MVLLSALALSSKAENSLYSAVIQSDGTVKLVFNKEQCAFTASAFLDKEPQNPDSAVVCGVKGRVVQLLETRLGMDWNPILVMLTANGEGYLLNISEVIAYGDMNCGAVHGLKNVKALDIEKTGSMPNPQLPVAVLDNGDRVTFVGSDTYSGFYAIDGYDAVVHITRDFGIEIEDKEGNILAEGTWYESFAGSGMVVLTCELSDGSNMEVEMYGDFDPNPSFVFYPDKDVISLPFPSEEKLKSTGFYK